ncbi:hypothetical protein DVH05_028707 [Phytophthora capsici]|nr:hypothetical protein DVH05_028707 [Phytophthora capsici]
MCIADAQAVIASTPTSLQLLIVLHICSFLSSRRLIYTSENNARVAEAALDDSCLLHLAPDLVTPLHGLQLVHVVCILLNRLAAVNLVVDPLQLLLPVHLLESGNNACVHWLQKRRGVGGQELRIDVGQRELASLVGRSVVYKQEYVSSSCTHITIQLSNPFTEQGQRL